MTRDAWQDGRGCFVLPQKREEAAYYTYGTPTGGQGQYAHPNMLSFLFRGQARLLQSGHRAQHWRQHLLTSPDGLVVDSPNESGR